MPEKRREKVTLPNKRFNSKHVNSTSTNSLSDDKSPNTQVNEILSKNAKSRKENSKIEYSENAPTHCTVGELFSTDQKKTAGRNSKKNIRNKNSAKKISQRHGDFLPLEELTDVQKNRSSVSHSIPESESDGNNASFVNERKEADYIQKNKFPPPQINVKAPTIDLNSAAKPSDQIWNSMINTKSPKNSPEVSKSPSPSSPPKKHLKSPKNLNSPKNLQNRSFEIRDTQNFFTNTDGSMLQRLSSGVTVGNSSRNSNVNISTGNIGTISARNSAPNLTEKDVNFRANSDVLDSEYIFSPRAHNSAPDLQELQNNLPPELRAHLEKYRRSAMGSKNSSSNAGRSPKQLHGSTTSRGGGNVSIIRVSRSSAPGSERKITKIERIRKSDSSRKNSCNSLMPQPVFNTGQESIEWKDGNRLSGGYFPQSGSKNLRKKRIF